MFLNVLCGIKALHNMLRGEVHCLALWKEQDRKNKKKYIVINNSHIEILF